MNINSINTTTSSFGINPGKLVPETEKIATDLYWAAKMGILKTKATEMIANYPSIAADIQRRCESPALKKLDEQAQHLGKKLLTIA